MNVLAAEAQNLLLKNHKINIYKIFIIKTNLNKPDEFERNTKELQMTPKGYFAWKGFFYFISESYRIV